MGNGRMRAKEGDGMGMGLWGWEACVRGRAQAWIWVDSRRQTLLGEVTSGDLGVQAAFLEQRAGQPSGGR